MTNFQAVTMDPVLFLDTYAGGFFRQPGFAWAPIHAYSHNVQSDISIKNLLKTSWLWVMFWHFDLLESPCMDMFRTRNRKYVKKPIENLMCVSHIFTIWFAWAPINGYAQEVPFLFSEYQDPNSNMDVLKVCIKNDTKNQHFQEIMLIYIWETELEIFSIFW